MREIVFGLRHVTVDSTDHSILGALIAGFSGSCGHVLTRLRNGQNSKVESTNFSDVNSALRVHALLSTDYMTPSYSATGFKPPKRDEQASNATGFCSILFRIPLIDFAPT